MTCRCATKEEHAQRAVDQANYSNRTAIESTRQDADKQIAAANKRAAELAARTPNPDDYVIERVQRLGPHLVLQVRYPSCKLCAYEGLKTLVILGVDEVAALRWRRIDPHFRLRTKDHATAHPKDAPSPSARFPGDAEGWADALAYANGKLGKDVRK
jgi:hypothetical protein